MKVWIACFRGYTGWVTSIDVYGTFSTRAACKEAIRKAGKKSYRAICFTAQKPKETA